MSTQHLPFPTEDDKMLLIAFPTRITMTARMGGGLVGQWVAEKQQQQQREHV